MYEGYEHLSPYATPDMRLERDYVLTSIEIDTGEPTTRMLD